MNALLLFFSFFSPFDCFPICFLDLHCRYELRIFLTFPPFSLSLSYSTQHGIDLYLSTIWFDRTRFSFLHQRDETARCFIIVFIYLAV